MGRQLVGIGIVAATLAFGAGSAIEAGHAHGPGTGWRVQADIQGPTLLAANPYGTKAVQTDIQGPTLLPGNPNGTKAVQTDIQGPTLLPGNPYGTGAVQTDIQGPTSVHV